MHKYNEHITIVHDTLPDEVMEKIFTTPGIFFDNVHVLYPADENGSHLLRFFSLEAIAQDDIPVIFIAEAIAVWAVRRNIVFDVVFAPYAPVVKDIAKHLAWTLGCDFAFWEYHDTGRFGDKLVEGKVQPGDRVLVFNGVTQTGRCVGQRLPSFVEGLGGTVVGAAVFAKGTNSFVRECELKYGSRFYSAIQVDIPVYSPEECPKCLAGDRNSLRPWTTLLNRET